MEAYAGHKEVCTLCECGGRFVNRPYGLQVNHRHAAPHTATY